MKSCPVCGGEFKPDDAVQQVAFSQLNNGRQFTVVSTCCGKPFEVEVALSFVYRACEEPKAMRDSHGHAFRRQHELPDIGRTIVF